MRLLYVAITPLIVLALIGVLLGDSFSSIIVEYLRYDSVDKDFDSYEIVFEVDTIQFGLTFIIGIILLATLLGIRVLGSGMADSSVHTVTVITFYVGIWTMLSVLSLDLLFLNFAVGSVIYIFLCLLYIIGVSNKLSNE